MIEADIRPPTSDRVGDVPRGEVVSISLEGEVVLAMVGRSDPEEGTSLVTRLTDGEVFTVKSVRPCTAVQCKLSLV